ncbi:MAG TPA: hypothetical protein VHA73_12015 [Acidimicrobiales bacterium]|jgi:hypothetical protein|nr:hypothetical protein [Acidimicrobiales bacterium]
MSAAAQGSRGPARQRLVRYGVIAVLVAFGVFAVVVMAGKNPNPADSSALQVVPPSLGNEQPPTGGAPAGSPAAPTVAPSDDGSGLGSGAGDGGGLAPSDLGTGSSSAPASDGEVAEPPSSGDTGTGSGGGYTPAPSTTVPPRVAVLGGLLATGAFATNTGMPLVCGVAATATGTFTKTSQMAQLASAITSGCAEAGSSGTEAIQKVSDNLEALAALNPALDPMVDQFVQLFNQIAANPDVPFVGSMTDLARLIQFFHS